MESQLREVLSENKALRGENWNLQSSIDKVAWRQERQELLDALEEEKEELLSSKQQQKMLEEELKLLKEEDKSTNMKDVVISEMQENVARLRSDLDDALEKVGWHLSRRTGRASSDL